MSGARRQRALSRRYFVQGAGAMSLGLLAGCGRWPGQGQPLVQVHRVGHLSQNQETLDLLREALREQGYVDGHYLALDSRVGPAEQLPVLAAELVALPVDVLMAATGTAALAAKSVTSSTPIVFIESSDAIGQGLVRSLARPGGNATGLSHLNSALVSKQLELLKETVPTIARVALLRNANAPLDSAGEVETTAQVLGVQLLVVEVQGVSGPGDVDMSIASLAGMQVDGLLALPALLTVRARIAAFAAEKQLPLVSAFRPWPEAGALMSYGPSQPGLYRRATYYMDRILKGTKPGDLPVEQPREFEFVINLRTAQALGLTIPHHVLLQATEVIQ
jgi:putative tryptophan/tyrosine transport system substrate-binding protein